MARANTTDSYTCSSILYRIFILIVLVYCMVLYYCYDLNHWALILLDSDMVDVFQRLSVLQLVILDHQLQSFLADIHPALQGHHLGNLVSAYSPRLA